MSEPVSSFLWVKIAGAAMGSSIAVVFKPGGDPWLRLFQRFVIGTILGVIFSPLALDYFKLPHVTDYWLASATACGLLSYLVLQMVFSEESLNVLRKISGKGGK